MVKKIKKIKFLSCVKPKNQRKEMSSIGSTVSCSKNHIAGFRHLNSLEDLTKQFICIVKNNKNLTININDVVREMKVKRRRLYDITNVLEGIGYLKKHSQNKLQLMRDDIFVDKKFQGDSSEEKKMKMGKEALMIERLLGVAKEEIIGIKEKFGMNEPSFLIYDDIKCLMPNYSNKTLIFESKGNIKLESEFIENSKERCEIMLKENKKYSYNHDVSNIQLQKYPYRLYVTNNDNKEINTYYINNEAVDLSNNNLSIPEETDKRDRMSFGCITPIKEDTYYH